MPKITEEKKRILNLEFVNLKICIESDHFRDENIKKDNILFQAFREDRSIEEKEYLLSLTSPINKDSGEGGNSLLSVAAIKGRNKVADFLLNQNANSEHKNNFGQTTFSLACEKGHLGVVDILYKHNPNLINISCNYGNYPVSYAAASKKFNVVEYLYNINHDEINKPIGDSTYVNQYVLIFNRDNLSFIRKFLPNCNNVNEKISFTKTKDTILIRCLKLDDLELAKILLERDDIDLRIKNNEGIGHNCFYVAAKKANHNEEFEDISRQIINRSIALGQDIDLYSEAEFRNPAIKAMISKSMETTNSATVATAQQLSKRQKTTNSQQQQYY